MSLASKGMKSEKTSNAGYYYAGAATLGAAAIAIALMKKKNEKENQNQVPFLPVDDDFVSAKL